MKDMLDKIKKVGVILFLGGFLFASTLATGLGAVIWGGITFIDLVTGKGKNKK